MFFHREMAESYIKITPLIRRCQIRAPVKLESVRFEENAIARDKQRKREQENGTKGRREGGLLGSMRARRSPVMVAALEARFH